MTAESTMSASSPTPSLPSSTCPASPWFRSCICGASRDCIAFGEHANVAGILGPAISDALWTLIQGLADHFHWWLTVNLFARACIFSTARYVSWFP
jgi:hypothetical protein